jgi:hypothetical protein
MTTPFIVYALPRSRTAWLSHFLSYKEWRCGHEQAVTMRRMQNVEAFFNRPNIGTVETAAAQGRHLIRHIVPDIKELVVLRPVDEVVDSLLASDISGVAVYDKVKLKRNMEYGVRELRKISNEPGVFTMDYQDLKKKEVCAKVFEHCLPYAFDETWWESFKDRNIQVDVKAALEYYFKHKIAVENFKKHCKSELRRLCRSGLVSNKIRAKTNA